jgi:hypothetical protein
MAILVIATAVAMRWIAQTAILAKEIENRVRIDKARMEYEYIQRLWYVNGSSPAMLDYDVDDILIPGSISETTAKVVSLSDVISFILRNQEEYDVVIHNRHYGFGSVRVAEMTTMATLPIALSNNPIFGWLQPINYGILPTHVWNDVLVLGPRSMVNTGRHLQSSATDPGYDVTGCLTSPAFLYDLFRNGSYLVEYYAILLQDGSLFPTNSDTRSYSGIIFIRR